MVKVHLLLHFGVTDTKFQLSCLDSALPDLAQADVA